jgi:hypothetical protein
MVQYVSKQKSHITSTQLAVALNLSPYYLHLPRLCPAPIAAAASLPTTGKSSAAPSDILSICLSAGCWIAIVVKTSLLTLHAYFNY